MDITDDQYTTALHRSWALAQMALSVEHLDDAIDYAKKAQTLAPFFDPTAFIKNGDKLREDIAAMEALRTFKLAIEKIKETHR